MTGEIQGVFGGQTAHIAVGGSGPVDVSISIYGPGGAVGYNPPGTVALEYYDPVRGISVRETVPIGGGFTASLKSTESPICNFRLESSQMHEGNRLRNSAAKAWRRHREELIPWVFGFLIYVAFMRQAEPSKFTVGMLAFLLVWPIVFAIRMAINMRRTTSIAD